MNFNSCNGRMYTIQSGDTLYKISGMFGVPLALILRANPFTDIYNLQVGDTICIPMTGATLPINLITYIVKDLETINDILSRFGIDIEDLFEYNTTGGIMLKPGLALQIPVSGQLNQNRTD